VVVFCGTGNNGGDGFVVARHLSNAGAQVEIALAGDVDRLSPDAAANHRICAAMGIPINSADAVSPDADTLIVDALLGTGFAGDVRAPLAAVIDRINETPKRRVVALDVPSGLDCDTGRPSNATVRADVTVTFVAGKVGFDAASARPYVGRVDVADIGSPPIIVERVLASGR
jgi:NAD(P)H-hydrate epimerase